MIQGKLASIRAHTSIYRHNGDDENSGDMCK